MKKTTAKAFIMQALALASMDNNRGVLGHNGHNVIPPYGRKRVKQRGKLIWSGDGTYIKAIHGPIGTPKPGKSK